MDARFMHSTIHLLGGRRLGNYVEHVCVNNELNNKSNIFLLSDYLLHHHVTPDANVPVHTNVWFAISNFFPTDQLCVCSHLLQSINIYMGENDSFRTKNPNLVRKSSIGI